MLPPPPPQNIILFELDFNIKIPLLRLLQFLNDNFCIPITYNPIKACFFSNQTQMTQIENTIFLIEEMFLTEIFKVI